MSTDRAKHLRRNQTDAEGKLWNALRNRGLPPYKFKRQVPLGRYIADFMCFERKLIVEVDGSQHGMQVEYDEARTRWLETQGYRVLRVGNRDVLMNLDGVLETIAIAARQ
jgi:very-short-patch-repair endonuclease